MVLGTGLCLEFIKILNKSFVKKAWYTVYFAFYEYLILEAMYSLGICGRPVVSEERGGDLSWDRGGRSGGCREAGMRDKRGEKSSWDMRPIRRMQRGRHAGQVKREILLGPEADPEDAERPACGTREERNPLGT